MSYISFKKVAATLILVQSEVFHQACQNSIGIFVVKVPTISLKHISQLIALILYVYQKLS